MMSKYFIDTEFLENGLGPIYLLSIGIVAEDGREYYAVNKWCPVDLANDWVKENVLPHIDWNEGRSSTRIMLDIEEFVNAGDGKPEFWGYFADYDWVVVCQLFGRMIDLPKGWPMYCMDIKQLCVSLGNPKLPEQGKGEHNALADARWNKMAYDFLMRKSGHHTHYLVSKNSIVSAEDLTDKEAEDLLRFALLDKFQSAEPQAKTGREDGEG
jgi:hypothetical protein